MNERTVAYYTLGCKLNFAETSTIARNLTQAGYRKVNFSDKADIYIINTCSVTEYADKKCRNAISKAHRTHTGAIVAVVGCYAQLKPQTIAAMPGVDLVLGANEKFDIQKYIDAIGKNTGISKHKEAIVVASDIEQVNSFFPSFSAGDRTRAFFKIQDGCDYVCSYCTIPLARGKSRNQSVAKTIEEAKKIAQTNVKEVVLTGVNIGDFGRSTQESFFDLIQQLDEIEGIERFRISSIEPNLLTNQIIDFVAQSKRFVPHFHIPLQSASNKILTAMRRRYKRELHAEKVELIKQAMPYACVGADVIVGFPTESEEDFEEAYHFLNEMQLSYLHVFSFSARPDTDAYAMGEKVEAHEIAQRSKMLNILSEKKRRMFYELHKGMVKSVLVEAEREGDFMFGFTDNYIKVAIHYDKNLINKLIDAKLTEINSEGVFEAQIETM